MQFTVLSPLFTLGAVGDVVDIDEGDRINTRALVRCRILAPVVEEPTPEPAPRSKRSKSAAVEAATITGTGEAVAVEGDDA